MNALKNNSLFFKPVRGNYEGDWLTNCFGCRISKHSLGCRIPCLNDTVEVLADNGVFRRFYNRRVQRPFFLNPLALCNIAEYQDRSNYIPLRILDSCPAVIDRYFKSVLCYQQT